MAIASVVFALTIEAVILCFRNKARIVPISYTLLVIFTACQSFLMSYLGTALSKESCITTATLASTVLVALTGYAVSTTQDFTVWRTLIFLVSIAGTCAAAFSTYFSYG